MFPYALICYLGTIELRYSCEERAQAKEKLQELLQIEQMGRYQSEGLGKIEWLGGRIRKTPEKALKRYPLSKRAAFRAALSHKRTNSLCAAP
jgi:hypothetical protein